LSGSAFSSKERTTFQFSWSSFIWQLLFSEQLALQPSSSFTEQGLEPSSFLVSISPRPSSSRALTSSPLAPSTWQPALPLRVSSFGPEGVFGVLLLAYVFPPPISFSKVPPHDVYALTLLFASSQPMPWPQPQPLFVSSQPLTSSLTRPSL
jgi:hypothetical protein